MYEKPDERIELKLVTDQKIAIECQFILNEFKSDKLHPRLPNELYWVYFPSFNHVQVIAKLITFLVRQFRFWGSYRDNTF